MLIARWKPIRSLFCVCVALFLTASITPRASAITSGTTATALNGQVQILVNNTYNCTGTLISTGWVLTAKHCLPAVATSLNTTVYLGDLALYTAGGAGELHSASTLIREPTHDVALIGLLTPTSRTDLVVRYGTDVPLPGKILSISGWGINAQVNSSVPSSTLQSSTQVNQSVSSTYSSTLGPNADLLEFSSSDGSTLTSGDSGAGVLYRGLVCGVFASSAFQTGHAVRTDAVSLWIASNTLLAPGGSCNPTRDKLLRLMPLGDSITYGYLSTTKNGYRGPLRHALIDEEFSVDIVGDNAIGTMYDNWNEGMPGWRIDEDDLLIKGSNTPILKYRPNIVTLMLGTNDMNQNWQVSTAPARLTGIITDILNKAPDATVLVATLVPSTDPAVEASIAAFNQSVPAVVQGLQGIGAHVGLADMIAVTTSDLADRLHPNDTGYQKIADSFNAAIQKADDKGWIQDPVDCGSIPAGCSDPAIAARDEPDGTDPNAPDTGWPAPPPIVALPIAPPGTPKAPKPAASAKGWGAPVLIAGGTAWPGADVQFTDMDGDGKADYVIVGPDTGGVIGFVNKGAAAVTDASGWSTAVEWAGGAAPGSTVRLADINGDGKPDYLLVDPTTGATTAYLNNGTDLAGAGGWIPEGQIAGGLGTGANVRFADMNGDGYADYVLVDPGTGALLVALNNGTDVAGPNGWNKVGGIAAGEGAPGANVRLADINGDGYADYLVVDPATGATQAWLNGGPSSDSWIWTPLGTIAAGGGTNGWPVQFADIDGDGMADYLIVAPTNGATWVYLNKGGSSMVPTLTGAGGWIPAGKIATGGGSGTVAFADLDGDGKSDYLLQNSDGSINASYNGGPSRSGWIWTAAGTVATGQPGSGLLMVDINGDGRADYIRWDLDSGDAMAWLNLGASTKGGISWLSTGKITNAPTVSGHSYTFAPVYGGAAAFIDIDFSTGAFGAWANGGQDSHGGWAWAPESILTHGTSTFPAGNLVAFADINGDGIADYLVVDPGTGATLAWINHGGDPAGATGWTYLGAIATGLLKSGDRLIYADINGDRLADYLIVHSDNSVDAWLNNGAGAH